MTVRGNLFLNMTVGLLIDNDNRVVRVGGADFTDNTWKNSRKPSGQHAAGPQSVQGVFYKKGLVDANWALTLLDNEFEGIAPPVVEH